MIPRAETMDLPTLLQLIALGLVGVLGVASATHDGESSGWITSLAARQLMYLMMGVLVYLVVQRVDYRTWADSWWLIYLVAIAALVGLVLFARPIAGARSWFELGPVRLQPSEPVKVVVCLAVAALVGEVTGKLNFSKLAQMALLIAVPVCLIALQPDLGTALTFVPLFISVAWLAGVRPRVLISLALIAALAAPIGWFVLLKPYQKERVLNVIDPTRDPTGTGYQVIQSRIAIGSGGMLGKGLFRGSQSRLDFLPARETDFVLAVLAEETGFVGVLIVLGLYLSIILRTLQTAGMARDHLGTVLAVGIASVWVGQLFINVGMVIGFLPTIGVPLPTLSYGGSSLLATFLAFGIVGSIRANRLVNA